MKIFITLIVISINLVSFAKEQNNSILVTVNGEPITLSDIIFESINKEINLYKYSKNKNLNGEIIEIRTKVLNNIIETKLLYQEFVRKKYRMPKELLQNTMNSIVGQREITDFKKELKNINITYEDFKQKAYEKSAYRIMLSEFCINKVNITPKKVYDYFYNSKKYIIPAKVNLELLLIKEEGRNKGKISDVILEIKKQLQPTRFLKPANEFAQLAKKYSDGPYAENCSLGWMEVNLLRKEFADAIKNLNKGDITKPFKLGNDICFLKISEFQKKQRLPLNKVKESIKSELRQKEEMKLYTKFILSLKNKALINYTGE